MSARLPIDDIICPLGYILYILYQIKLRKLDLGIYCLCLTCVTYSANLLNLTRDFRICVEVRLLLAGSFVAVSFTAMRAGRDKGSLCYITSSLQVFKKVENLKNAAIFCICFEPRSYY